jgi:hypothetical protein
LWLDAPTHPGSRVQARAGDILEILSAYEVLGIASLIPLWSFPSDVNDQNGCEQTVSEGVHCLWGRVLYRADEEMSGMWRARGPVNGISRQVSGRGAPFQRAVQERLERPLSGSGCSLIYSHSRFRKGVLGGIEPTMSSLPRVRLRNQEHANGRATSLRVNSNDVQHTRQCLAPRTSETYYNLPNFGGNHDSR